MANDILNDLGQYRHRPDLDKHRPAIDRLFAMTDARPQQFTGSAPTAPGEVLLFNGLTTEVIVHNVDAAQVLEVSFDGGTNFESLATATSQTFDVTTHSVILRGIGGDADYRVFAAIGWADQGEGAV